MDHKLKEPEDICSQSRTCDTHSSDQESTANGSLQLTELYTARGKPINIEPISYQLKTYKKYEFCSTFLNLTKKYLRFVAQGPRIIDVPNDLVLRSHNFSPHGNVNFIAKWSVKQHQEDIKVLVYVKRGLISGGSVERQFYPDVYISRARTAVRSPSPSLP